MHPTSFKIPLNTLPYDNNVHRIRRGSTVPIALQSYECHFNWRKLYPLTFNELDHGVSLLEEKFREEAGELYTILKSTSGISLIAKKLCQSYFNLELGNFAQSRLCLEEAEKFTCLCATEYCTLSDDYVSGFTYILEGLGAFLEIQITTSKSSPSSPASTGSSTSLVSRRGIKATPAVNLDGLTHFRKLPAKAKHIVWTVKDVFFIYSFRSHVERSEWMEAILEMEPYIPKWHFHIHKALHDTRKLIPRQNRVFVEDPLSISYFCLCLAEIFTEGIFPNQYPCQWGSYKFTSSQHVLGTIVEKTMKVLDVDCHLDGVYLNLSDIQMFRLPPSHRNLELAMRCLKKALRLNTINPRTHHRMGLAHFKLKNHKNATLHFQEAIKDGNNIGGIFGLLQILMASPINNSIEIQSLFKYTLKNQDLTRVWDKRCLRTLHYLKGCFHFMQENNDESLHEAITSWIIAHDNGSRKWSYYFMNLSHQCSRFKWPTKRLNLTNVSNALKHAAYLEQTQFKQLLLDICSEVDDAIRRDDERKNSSN